jgi:hypothetical protein
VQNTAQAAQLNQAFTVFNANAGASAPTITAFNTAQQFYILVKIQTSVVTDTCFVNSAHVTETP